MSTNWQVSFQQAMRLRNKARKTIAIKKNLSDLLVCHSSSLYSAAKDQSVSWLSVKVMNIIPSTASYHIYFSFKSVFSAYLPFSLSPVFPSPLSLRFSFPFFSVFHIFLPVPPVNSLSFPAYLLYFPSPPLRLPSLVISFPWYLATWLSPFKILSPCLPFPSSGRIYQGNIFPIPCF